MPFPGETAASDSASTALLSPTTSPKPIKIPKDSFNFAFTIHFLLGLGYLFPWNTFVTAVDYFSYIYPDTSVDRLFAVAYTGTNLIFLLFIVYYSYKADSYVRINIGLAVFVVSMLVVPVMDVVYIKGRVGSYDGFYVTVAAVALAGSGDALVQSGIIGSACELPERYMQAVVAGTAASEPTHHGHKSPIAVDRPNPPAQAGSRRTTIPSRPFKWSPEIFPNL